MHKNAFSFVLSIVFAAIAAAPGFAQGINGQAGSTNGQETYATSGGDSGNYSNTPGMPTTTQTGPNQEADRTVQLNDVRYNLLAPNSVDTSSFPSGEFTYGFPNESVAPFMGVDRGDVGGYLPPTSTSSVNLNTCDLPFIRAPQEGNVGSGGGFGSGVSINFGPGGVGVNFGGPGFSGNINPGSINFGASVGPLTVGGSVGTQQAINGLSNFSVHKRGCRKC